MEIRVSGVGRYYVGTTIDGVFTPKKCFDTLGDAIRYVESTPTEEEGK